MMLENPPKNQRMPSDESIERTPSIRAAESNHDTMTSTHSATNNPMHTRLLFIGFEIIDIQNTQL